MESLKLKDISLCAIVRNEIINPAGGISSFIEKTMPYLDAGVIVDTGSTDGTRDVLEEMASKYPELKVYWNVFSGFSEARNFSLSKVKTKYVFVLDADERVLLDSKEFLSWDFLYNYFNNRDEFWPKGLRGYNLNVTGIYPNGDKTTSDAHNPRIFAIEGVRYRNEVYEFLEIPEQKRHKATCFLNRRLLHFLPQKRSLLKKRELYKAWQNLNISEQMFSRGMKRLSSTIKKVNPLSEMKEYQ